jgi:hypothetical protein
MSDRSKTVLEVQADISNIMSKLALVDNELTQMADQAHNGTQKIGAGFTVAGQQAAAGSKMMAKGSNQAMTAVTGLNWAVSDMPYFFQNTRMGIMAVSNNITPLVQNMAYLQRTTGSLKGTLRAMGAVFTGPMGIVFAITAVVSIIQALSFIMAKHKAKIEGATEANKEFAKSLEQINKSVSVDALASQLETSNKLIVASDQVIKNKKETIALEEEEIGKLNEKYANVTDLENDLSLLMTDKTRTKSKEEEDTLNYYIQKKEQEIAQANLKNSNLDNEIKKRKTAIKTLNEEITTQTKIQAEENKRIEVARERLALLDQVNFKSEKEMQYKEKVFEYETSKLPLDEQIAAWEAEKAKITGNELKDKERILEIEKKLDALHKQQKTDSEGDNSQFENAQKAAIKSKAAYEKVKTEHDLFMQGIDSSSDEYLQKEIDRIQALVDASKQGSVERLNLETELDDNKAKLIQNQMERIEVIREYELDYQRRMADALADGDLEGVYEQVLGNIKQKLIQFALDRLGITQAMINMEQLIITAGEKGIDSIRDLFHKKEKARQVEETTGAAIEAGTKGTASASGIPFPGNLAAIGLVLSVIFSALSKAKTTGTQIVAAAEGAVINRPTLLLAGEALNRSGTEIVMPEKNFNRYMEERIIPGIMTKVNVNNKGTEQRLDRVERAIYAIGKQIPGETGKAVKRALRGKF